MKRLRGLLIGACLAVGINAPAQSQTFYMSGNQYRSITEDAQTFYVMGSLDQLRLWLLSTNPALHARLERCASGITGIQLHAIVDAWLTAHPEVWDNAMATSFYQSLFGACEKRGTPIHFTK